VSGASAVASGGQAGVVVGCDARHRSAEFADEAARVLAGAGIRVYLLPRPGPTPLLAFAVRHLSAAAGVMITASHNPAADNGYKLYLGDGAQIVPPTDAEIEVGIARLGPLSQVPVAPLDDPLITRHGDEVAEAYLAAIHSMITKDSVPDTTRIFRDHGVRPGEGALRVVYTPMHGVARELALRAMKRAGFPTPHVVAAQAEPDPGFPTVAFPNPEEPGALDLALADARAIGADLVLANDPDGDRLAVAVPDRRANDPGTDAEPGTPSGAATGDGGATGRRTKAGGTREAGGWRVLTGDQVGGLLGADLLERTAADPEPAARLVVSTIVSSTLLSKIATAAGAHYAETLTGFKWVARAADNLPGSRFVFGYEEALGYAVGDIVRDKDGISAALAVLRLATSARAAGQTLLHVYDALETKHGVHLTSRFAPRVAAPADVMARLRATALTSFTGRQVTAPPASPGGQQASTPPASIVGTQPIEVTDLATGSTGLPSADGLVYRMPGARVVVRPSGTEHRIKAYIEIVEPVTGDGLAAARHRAEERLGPLRTAVETLLTIS
jgi:phosphomannomutase